MKRVIRTKSWLVRRLPNLITAMAIILICLPLLNLFMGSLKSPLDVIDIPYKFIFQPTMINYWRIFKEMNFQRNIINSMVITMGAVPLSLTLGCLAAYSLSRFTFRGSQQIVLVLLAIRMLPFVVIMVPLYLMMQWLGLLDSRRALILTHTGGSLPFVICLLIGFFKEIPRDIEEAAMIDGCSRIGALVRVILPLATPGLVATSILVWIIVWNDFLIAVILTVTNISQVATVAMASLITDRIVLWGQLSAAAIVFILPLFLFAFFAQKYLLRGLTLGAIKG